MTARPSRYLFWGLILGYIAATASLASLGPIGKYLFPFSILYFCSFLFLLGLLRTFPVDWPARTQLAFILLVGVIVRLAFLSFPPSHDVNRYVWEGYILNEGFNPFIHAPGDPILKPLVNEIWHGVNHKDASACYPPLAMLFFRVGAFISPTPVFFKLFMALFDLATVWVLACLLRLYGMPL